MRATTIASDPQLALPIEKSGPTAPGWAGLPEQARANVLVLLARLIARGVLGADTETGHPAPAEAADSGQGPDRV